MRGQSSAWLFQDHYPGSLARDLQLMSTALLRLQVLILAPIRRLFMKVSK